MAVASELLVAKQGTTTSSRRCLPGFADRRESCEAAECHAEHSGRISIGTSSRTRLPSRYGEAETKFRPRLYCRGEQPMTRLKAVLKALSDS